MDMRKLPSLIFIYDLSGCDTFIIEAKKLKIPIVGFVSNKINSNKVFENITLPLPIGNSIDSIFFFSFFVKACVHEGISLHNYVLKKKKSLKYFDLKNPFWLGIVKNPKIFNYNIHPENEDYMKYSKLSYNNLNSYYDDISENVSDNFADFRLETKELLKDSAKHLYWRNRLKRYYRILLNGTLKITENHSLELPGIVNKKKKGYKKKRKQKNNIKIINEKIFSI